MIIQYDEGKIEVDITIEELAEIEKYFYPRSEREKIWKKLKSLINTIKLKEGE